jgi:hypothetical protein
MHDADHHDPRHQRMNLAPQKRERVDVASHQDASAHPRGRVWWKLPPVVRTGPWRRIRAPDK